METKHIWKTTRKSPYLVQCEQCELHRRWNGRIKQFEYRLPALEWESKEEPDCIKST